MDIGWWSKGLLEVIEDYTEIKTLDAYEGRVKGLQIPRECEKCGVQKVVFV